MMCFPSAVVCSPVPGGSRTFLLPEGMLQMSANESRENDLARGLLRHRGLHRSPRMLRNWGTSGSLGLTVIHRAWLRLLMARPPGGGGGNATGLLLLSDARAFWCGTAPNHAPSVIFTADSSTSDAAASAVKP